MYFRLQLLFFPLLLLAERVISPLTPFTYPPTSWDRLSKGTCDLPFVTTCYLPLFGPYPTHCHFMDLVPHLFFTWQHLPHWLSFCNHPQALFSAFISPHPHFHLGESTRHLSGGDSFAPRFSLPPCSACPSPVFFPSWVYRETPPSPLVVRWDDVTRSGQSNVSKSDIFCY